MSLKKNLSGLIAIQIQPGNEKDDYIAILKDEIVFP